MTDTDTQKQPSPRGKMGRPSIPEEDRLIHGAIRLTRKQWEQYRALGGVEWLREAIKRATARRELNK